MKRLEGKVSIVTGASRGIGRGIAVRLAQEGAKVVINHRGSTEGAEETARLIREAGGEALVVQADVSRMDEAQRLVQETINAFGQVDILVNNAGTTRDTLLMMMKEDQWDVVVDTNLKSVFSCCKAVARPMVKRKFGRIINISSVSGLAGQGGQTNYAASKAGVIAFSKPCQGIGQPQHHRQRRGARLCANCPDRRHPGRRRQPAAGRQRHAARPPGNA